MTSTGTTDGTYYTSYSTTGTYFPLLVIVTDSDYKVKVVFTFSANTMTHFNVAIQIIVLLVSSFKTSDGFAIASSRRKHFWRFSTLTDVEPTVALDPKEVVKLFGRLAEKYIMLDSSGGMCCYSGCAGKTSFSKDSSFYFFILTQIQAVILPALSLSVVAAKDCEYRLPDGGYRMADQSSSRPKWIPVYEKRNFESSGKNHTTKWSSQIFKDGPAVTKDVFVKLLSDLEYTPPLGGPYLAASSAGIENDAVAKHLFDVLVLDGKEKLTKHQMSLKLKELAKGEEGLIFPTFLAAFSGFR